MRVTSGAKWFTPSDNQREYAISFDLDDLISNMGQENVDALSFKEKIKALNSLADAYTVAYVAKNGGMPTEYAQKRLAELSNG